MQYIFKNAVSYLVAQIFKMIFCGYFNTCVCTCKFR